MLPRRFAALAVPLLRSLPLVVAFAATPLVGCAASRAPGHGAEEAPAREPLRVAVTVDDLPGSLASTAWPKSRIVQTIVAALVAHRVPAPVGFVNGIYGDDADAERALGAWLAAGFPVGNHSFSHVSANQQRPEAFVADVQRNHAWLAERMSQPQLTRYFRFPYLERGESPEQRAAIRTALSGHGYRVAGVSLDFADWGFVGAYLRCLDKADDFALTQLGLGYLQNARASLFWSSETSERVFGHAVPQVLLLHAIVPTALNIEALLTQYEQEGVQWIPLTTALADAAYAEPVQEDRGDFDVISEQIRRKRLPVYGFMPRALPLLELACR